MKSRNQSECDTKFNPLFNILNNGKPLDNELEIYKIDNKQLNKELNTLKKQILVKDKLLDQKTKQIIHCTSENLRLKQQIDTLQKKLNSSKHRNKKKKKKTSETKASKHNKKQISFMNDNEINNLPYFIPTISTSVSTSSNLSAQAVKLSFPNSNHSISTSNTSLPSKDSTTAHCTNVLSPIAESNHSDKSSPTFTIQISNDNMDIHDKEWRNCMAEIDTNITEYMSDENTIISLASNETEKALERNLDANDVLFSDDDMISYMSDNTMLLLDMNYIELPKTSQQMYSDELCIDLYNECDTIIKSPFNLTKVYAIRNTI